MVFFNGSMKIKICEAANLKATDFATRHSRQISVLDPYISIDVDDIHVARTTSKQKSNRPTWNEEFRTEVHNGQNVGFTVFHDAAIPPDIFIANCTVAFEDLATSPCLDIWVTIIIICVGEFGNYTK